MALLDVDRALKKWNAQCPEDHGATMKGRLASGIALLETIGLVLLLTEVRSNVDHRLWLNTFQSMTGPTTHPKQVIYFTYPTQWILFSLDLVLLGAVVLIL